jgi:hypothetical protein
MAADSGFLKSFVIVGRATRKTKIFELDYTFDRVLYAFQENGLITSTLFEWWTWEVLFPYVDRARSSIGDNGGKLSCWSGAVVTGATFPLTNAPERALPPLFLTTPLE